MRIIHTESSTGWGGQENRTLNELVGMRERGHEMAVLCQPGARLADRARDAGFTTFSVAMRGALDIPAVAAMRRIFKEFRPAAINTHSGRDTQLAGLAARSLGRGRPSIVRTRHLALAITSRLGYNVLPDHVVTVSAFVSTYLIAAGVEPQRITTVRTGVDLSRYAPVAGGGTLRRELGLPASALLIGTVAILRQKKGHADLLAAAPAIFERFPDAHIVFAGDGPQKDNLETAIDALGLRSRVHMLGLRRDVINILQSLDVFVLPTHQEALGTAFIEAAAMGLPVVGTAVDGVPEVVVDGTTGLLVPPRNSEALGQAISQLLTFPESRAAMGVAAREWIGRQFSLPAMAAGMEDVYRNLIGQT